MRNYELTADICCTFPELHLTLLLVLKLLNYFLMTKLDLTVNIDPEKRPLSALQ